MNTSTPNNRNRPREPERRIFSNDYISSCALYLIDGKQYTPAHLFLNEKIQEIRGSEQQEQPLTYSEMCDWVKRLIEIYMDLEDN